MNSSDWEKRDTPKPHWDEGFSESIQTIRRMNIRREGPITHTVESGTLVYGYKSLEEAMRGKLRLEAEGYQATIKRV